MAQANLVSVSSQKPKTLNSACGIISNTIQEENLHWNLIYTNGKFTKVKFPLLYYFLKSLIDSLCNRNSKRKIH